MTNNHRRLSIQQNTDDNNIVNYSFPGLDVQQCYEILEKIGNPNNPLSLQQFNEQKELFWQILEKEISKINDGYVEREQLCRQRFEMFDISSFIRANKNVCIFLFISLHKTIYKRLFINFIYRIQCH